MQMFKYLVSLIQFGFLAELTDNVFFYKYDLQILFQTTISKYFIPTQFIIHFNRDEKIYAKS